MTLSPASEHGPSLLMIEGSATAIAVALAFAWPQIGSRYFSGIERLFKQLARRKGLSVAIVGAAAFLLRLAILPLCPAPYPFIPNDFSFLLAADTFASGRLTNPTPAMWVHFETIHIAMKPTYMSMYFPGQGLALALGKVLTGHPWFGVLCTSALMCAALCWMLQAWLPPGWALLGGIIAILRLGLFCYWINTYSGGGSLAALGGALVLGALPRLMRGGARFRYGMLMAIGIILLATSRPYEGLLLCLPVAFVLARWIFSGKNRPPATVLFRMAALPLLLVIAAGIWMGYYDYRAFGHTLTPPYKVDRTAYAMAPYFVWQSARPEPLYRHQVLRNFYSRDELRDFEKIHSASGFVPQTLVKALRGILFFAGIALLPPLLMFRRVLMDHRTRFFVICTLVLMAGMAIEVFLVPHYLAPFTAVFYVLGLQAMRHLRLWKPGDQPVGMALVRLCVVLCFLLAGLRLYAQPLHMEPAEWPVSEWTGYWYGPGHFGGARAGIEARLEQLPGKQLVIVRYSPGHNPVDEWVYNAPDIDHSRVIWARGMGPANNLELIDYYKDRTVWLVQPDTKPVEVTPYSLPKSTQPGS
ncbi:MAG: hypothetical protein WA634_17590 [Silvibacterium sp.]